MTQVTISAHKPHGRATLAAIPAVTVKQTKGKPPVGAGRLVIHREFTLKFVCCRLNAVAFAYPYVTRHRASGQRTDDSRVTGAQQ